MRETLTGPQMLAVIEAFAASQLPLVRSARERAYCASAAATLFNKHAQHALNSISGTIPAASVEIVESGKDDPNR